MNPITDPPPLLPLLQSTLPAPPPNPPSVSCNRHPDETFTGFCPSCLYERLSVLDQNASSSSAAGSFSSRKPPFSAVAALKTYFKPSHAVVSSNSTGINTNRIRPGFFPELRRTQSFSASRNEGFSGVFEPQRRSCDVRGRSTLWALFSQENVRKKETRIGGVDGGSGRVGECEVTVEPRDSNVTIPVLEEKTLSESDEDDDVDSNGVDIESLRESSGSIEEKVQEIEQEVEEIEVLSQVQVEEDSKSMKDYIDLDSQTTKKPSVRGSFWSAASVFSKKLQKWRQKQKLKKRDRSSTLPVEKPIGRQFRETQSEIADYGFGRRSCDTDPRLSLDAGRFSLDAGRVSFEDPRYSLDEPRASWDGYLIGKGFTRMPTMLSVVEDAPVNHVSRSDSQIPVEEDDNLPGGSAQTRDYYSDSSSKRRKSTDRKSTDRKSVDRKSIDRSSSIRRSAAAVVTEMDELKSAKVTPAIVDSFIHGPKLIQDSNSIHQDCSVENFDMSFRENASKAAETKKSRRWSKGWNIWSFINRRNTSKYEDDDSRLKDDDSRLNRANGIGRTFSQSWQELRGEQNGEIRPGFNPKLARSNSSVSWRTSTSFEGRKIEMNNHGSSKNKKQEPVLERNRSARFSPNHVDNGLLRFYTAPIKGSQKTGWGKNKSNQAHSVARSVLRLY